MSYLSEFHRFINTNFDDSILDDSDSNSSVSFSDLPSFDPPPLTDSQVQKLSDTASTAVGIFKADDQTDKPADLRPVETAVNNYTLQNRDETAEETEDMGKRKNEKKPRRGVRSKKAGKKRKANVKSSTKRVKTTAKAPSKRRRAQFRFNDFDCSTLF